MKCKNCGAENAPLKKCCSNCGAFLEGLAINNVTGKVGYRNADGTFDVDDGKDMSIKLAIDAFKEKQAVLNANLKASIESFLYEFEGETGYYPKSIDIIMIDVRTVSDSKPEFILAGVETEFDFGGAGK